MGQLQMQLDQFLPLVQRVMQQTRSWVLEGRQVPAREKVLRAVFGNPEWREHRILCPGLPGGNVV
jgi:hypothetical protein